MSEEATSLSLSLSEPPVSDKWWLLPFVEACVLPVGIGAIVFAALIDVFIPWVADLLVYGIGFHVMMASYVLGPVGIYFDRQYVGFVSDWTPSQLYYMALIPGWGLLIAMVYIYNRHDNIGVP